MSYFLEFTQHTVIIWCAFCTTWPDCTMTKRERRGKRGKCGGDGITGRRRYILFAFTCLCNCQKWWSLSLTNVMKTLLGILIELCSFLKVSAPLPPQSAAPFLLSFQSCQSERDLICPATISKLEVTRQWRPRNSKSLK